MNGCVIARVFGASIEDIFFYEPDPEGAHRFKHGLVVEVTSDEDKGVGTDSKGQ